MAIRDAIRDRLKGFDLTAAILFGSFVEKRERRDIDVMIVLDEMGEIARIRDALSLINNQIDPTFVTVATFEENISIGNPFYLNVLDGEPVIGGEYLEQCRERAGRPSEEIIRRYLDLSIRAYERAKESQEYFDCYVSCKFLIEHLMMKRGMYVTDPRQYDSYLTELDLPMNQGSCDVLSRILMHRRGDVELCEGDIEHGVRIVEKMIEWILIGCNTKMD
ncbi:MAG TPA: hypothetical protein EYP67_00415 [Methanosarcinales archaeon]|nr:hypothetical protein [Methanosarcinales archaeon]